MTLMTLMTLMYLYGSNSSIVPLWPTIAQTYIRLYIGILEGPHICTLYKGPLDKSLDRPNFLTSFNTFLFLIWPLFKPKWLYLYYNQTK